MEGVSSTLQHTILKWRMSLASRDVMSGELAVCRRGRRAHRRGVLTGLLDVLAGGHSIPLTIQPSFLLSLDDINANANSICKNKTTKVLPLPCIALSD